MKRQIRRGVFETNSSSVHSLTMCLQSEFDKWVAGELIFDDWREELVEITQDVKDDVCNRYLTYEQFNDWNYIEYETFETHQTINNQKIVAFGYYGHD